METRIKEYVLKCIVNDNSMNDNTDRSIIENDVLIVERIKIDFRKLNTEKYLYLIGARETLILRQIKEINQQEGYIILSAFNPAYGDYKVQMQEVKKLYKVINYSRDAKFDFN